MILKVNKCEYPIKIGYLSKQRSIKQKSSYSHIQDELLLSTNFIK